MCGEKEPYMAVCVNNEQTRTVRSAVSEMSERAFIN